MFSTLICMTISSIFCFLQVGLFVFFLAQLKNSITRKENQNYGEPMQPKGKPRMFSSKSRSTTTTSVEKAVDVDLLILIICISQILPMSFKLVFWTL